MEGTFQLIDVIILIGFSQGIFLTLAIHRIPDNNKSANTILSLLIGISTIILGGRFLYFQYANLFIVQSSLVVDSLIFLFGPLLYTYTRRLLFKGNQDFLLSYYHFIPFILMLTGAIINLLVFTPEAYYEYLLAGHLTMAFALIMLAMIIFNSYYLIRSFLLIQTYKKSGEEIFSFSQSPLTYLYGFHLVIAACFGLWFIIFHSGYVFQQPLPLFNYDTLWMLIPLFLYVIGYFSLKQQELFKIQLVEKKETKRIRLNPDETIALKQRLEKLMQEEKLFMQGDLTLIDIANRLQTSRNNISWLLNNECNLTFNDFVNNYRITEFLERIDQGEHLRHTILAIAIEVGFNSKSTFNKAFKRKMDDTPSNYIRQRKLSRQQQ